MTRKRNLLARLFRLQKPVDLEPIGPMAPVAPPTPVAIEIMDDTNGPRMIAILPKRSATVVTRRRRIAVEPGRRVRLSPHAAAALVEMGAAEVILPNA
jgi:hypothetical protein